MSSLSNCRSYSLALLKDGERNHRQTSEDSCRKVGFIPVVYGAAERPNDALDAELAVARALEDLGFTTEIMEVELELASIETLPSRRPLLVFNLVDAINCDGRFAPLVTGAARCPWDCLYGLQHERLIENALKGWDQTEASPCGLANSGVVYGWHGA